MLHARYLLLATAREALGAGWVFDVSQPPFTSSEMIRDSFDCSRGSRLKPMLSRGCMACMYLSLRKLSPTFHLSIYNFQFCTVKAFKNLRRGLCCPLWVII